MEKAAFFGIRIALKNPETEMRYFSPRFDSEEHKEQSEFSAITCPT
jgi:hypothetical protein